MKRFIIILVCLSGCLFAHAQKGTKEVYYGNQAYRKGDLKKAVQYYEKALKTAPDNDAARINLALAQSKLKATDKSVANFDKAIKESKSNPALQSRLNYDKGTTLAKGQKYEAAIDAFKNVLRASPEDADARENLQKAINELKKQQKKNNKENKQDKQDNKDKKDQPKQDQQQQNKKQQQQRKMTKAEADKLLQALRRQEKETQKKIQKKAGGPPPQDGEDW